MIKRAMTEKLKYLATKFPSVAILGPRQSGKTTLAKAVFPDYGYVSLENNNIRKEVSLDPQKFLSDISNDYPGVILDEFQFVPELTSYIKTYVDEHKDAGCFILTGSQNYLMNQSITQSLAGRVAILTLLPLSMRELSEESLLSDNYKEAMFNGFYPRIYDEDISPKDMYPNYISTYVERDVRQITKVVDLSLFQTFIGLCAGRIGQLLDVTSLSNDCGIDVKTVKEWLSLLEASYIIYLLRPHYKNFSKRLIKSPKIFFYDTGLACSLLGIESYKDLTNHYLRGNLFECFVLSDLMKYQYTKGYRPSMYFWRDKSGHEIDCIIEEGGKILRIEVKAGMTIFTDAFKNLKYWANLAETDLKGSYLIYLGDEGFVYGPDGVKIVRWNEIEKVFEE